MEAKKGCPDHTIPETSPWIDLSWGGVRGVWWGLHEPALPHSVTLLVPCRCPMYWQPCRLETVGRKPASPLPALSLASSLTSTPPSCLPQQGSSIRRTRKPLLTTGTRVGGKTPWPAPAQLRIGGAGSVPLSCIFVSCGPAPRRPASSGHTGCFPLQLIQMKGREQGAHVHVEADVCLSLLSTLCTHTSAGLHPL